jgi:nucleoside-diphosphate-sugar epimerase
MDTHMPSFELIVLNPPVVFGPLLHSIGSMRELNTSNEYLYRFMSSAKTAPMPPDSIHVCIDVRVSNSRGAMDVSFSNCSFQDLAIAHYQAAFAPGVGNKRFFVTRGSNSNQEICDIMRKALPAEWDQRIPLGTPGNYNIAPGLFKVDNTSSREILGISYRPFEETIADSAKNFAELKEKFSS